VDVAGLGGLTQGFRMWAGEQAHVDTIDTLMTLDRMKWI